MSAELTIEILKLDFLEQIFDILKNYQDYDLIKLSLCILENFLKNSIENKDNRIILLFESYSLSKILEELQNSPNQKIYEKVVNLIEKYYLCE